MRFFPGVDTPKERKRFVVFHAVTLITISPIIASVFIFFEYGSRWGLNILFTSTWFLACLCMWNFIGSWRFYIDAEKEGFFVARFVGMMMLFIFPFVYLHTLWLVLFKDRHEDD